MNAPIEAPSGIVVYNASRPGTNTPAKGRALLSVEHTRPSIAALTALAKSTLTDGDRVSVDHYYSDALGGGGRFVWDASSTETANGGTVIASDEGGDGRWLRVFDHDHYITFEMFGAKQLTSFTDDHDSTAAIQAAIDFLVNPTAVWDNFKQAHRILVTGLFGISDSIEWRYKDSLSMQGVSFAIYRAPGFFWLGEIDTEKAMLIVGQSRWCIFDNLRFMAPYTDSPETAQRAAIEMDATINVDTGSLYSSNNTYSHIYIGRRDGFEDSRFPYSPIAFDSLYQFRYGIVSSGTDTNCDFMRIRECRIDNCEYAIHNNFSQHTSWVLRELRLYNNDHAIHCNTRMYAHDCEMNQNRKEAIVAGLYMEMYIDGLITELNKGSFVGESTSGVGMQLVVTNSGLDFCHNDDDFPDLVKANCAANVNITFKSVRLFNNNRINIGTTTAARVLDFDDTSTVEIVIDSPTSSQRIFYRGSKTIHRSPSGLTDNGYAPFSNLLHPVNEPDIDYQRYDLPTDRVRLGNRFRGAALEIEAINVMLDEQTGGTITFEDMIPAGSLLFGVITQNVGATGATTYEVGDGTDQDRWGSVSGANMTSPGGATIADFADAGPVFVKADTSVVLTATSGSFSNAKVLATAIVALLKPRYYNPAGAQ